MPATLEASTVSEAEPHVASDGTEGAASHGRWSWRLSLIGMALLVFAVVALSSPGRIDVVDGQTRYEVGRSYVEHGDSIVRDPDAWFAVFPGRNGARYSSYRFPQSIVAAAAILVADVTGPVREVRRHFFFSLSGAVLCAAMAALYACWFRRMGHGRGASLAWATGGIFCTPTWFYGTTVFDDVLGSLMVLAAISAAWGWHERRPIAAALVSGSLLGLAFNCKPPLALFLPATIAALWDSRRSGDERRRHAGIMVLCLALGIVVYKVHDLWKFPPSTWPALAQVQGAFAGLWPGNVVAGLISLLISPGMGALWYWPAIVVALFGIVRGARRAPRSAVSSHGPRAIDCGRFAWAAGLSSSAFLLFIASIRFFSGEPAWGPRYLTPVFALLWVFVPAGLSRLGPRKSAALLAASLVIQMAGLSIDTMRFFSGDNEPTAGRFLEDPWSYFHFDRSQLLARPQQIWDVLGYDGPVARAFSPAREPTLPWYVFVIGSTAESHHRSNPPDVATSNGPDPSNPVERLLAYVRSRQPLDTRANHVINSFRPWWVAYRFLPLGERPLDLDHALRMLLLTGAVGSGMLVVSLSPSAEHRRSFMVPVSQ